MVCRRGRSSLRRDSSRVRPRSVFPRTAHGAGLPNKARRRAITRTRIHSVDPVGNVARLAPSLWASYVDAPRERTLPGDRCLLFAGRAPPGSLECESTRTQGKRCRGFPPSAQDAHKPKVRPLRASAHRDRIAIVQLHQFIGLQCVPRLGPCKLADKHPENCSAEDSAAGRSASGNACDDFGIEWESGAAIQSRLGPPATTHTATASRME